MLWLGPAMSFGVDLVDESSIITMKLFRIDSYDGACMPSIMPDQAMCDRRQTIDFVHPPDLISVLSP